VLSRVSVTLLAIYTFASAVPRVASAQHITIDGRLSPAKTLVGPTYTIGANLGKQVGSNLFQSFGLFGLTTGESATFSGPVSVSNVIGRVTGGSPSSINGKIQSTITAANLYLINPSGVVFGPNATVNVSGSFHASTADYLKMSDGAKFQATNPDGSTLSAAPPAAFGFLTASSAQISVNGSSLGPVPGTLGLVGGPVSITGATLNAPAGMIQVTSAAGTGEVPVDPRNTPAMTVMSFGPVTITGGAKLDVSNPSGLGSGASVFIHSGALTISASEINADNYGLGSGGQLVLRGEEQVTLSNSTVVHTNSVGAGAGTPIVIAAGALLLDGRGTAITSAAIAGAGGQIAVTAGRLIIQHGAAITSASTGTRPGGDVSITVPGDLIVDGSAASAATGILSVASGAGAGGKVSVSAGSLSLANNGGIRSSTTISGPAGDLAIAVGGTAAIDGTSANPLFATNPAFLTGIASSALGGAGNAGHITLSAGALTVRTNGLVASNSFGLGKTGNVLVEVAGAAAIDGTSALTPTGIFTSASGLGSAGTVAVHAAELSIANNGAIQSTTASAGNAGNVSVSVSGALSIDGRFDNPAFYSNLARNLGFITGITSGSAGTGNGGIVTVEAGSLSIANGGIIGSGTIGGSGNGGDIVVDVGGALAIDGSHAIPLVLSRLFFGTGIISGSSDSGNGGSVTVHAASASIVNGGNIGSGSLLSGNGAGSGGNVTVDIAGPLTLDGTAEVSNDTVQTRISSGSQGSGNAGTVTVTAENLTIINTGTILTGTFGAGKGGNIAVDVTGTLSIDGSLQAADPFEITGISSRSNIEGGNAGTVAVRAGRLSIGTNGEISSDTLGTGSAGTVSVSVAGNLSIDGRSSNHRTGISTDAEAGTAGDAGPVTVDAAAVSLLNGGVITSATAGLGKGGSIRVAGSDILIAGTRSRITAQSTAAGDAGSITVSGARLRMNNGAAISTEAEASTANGGNITLKVGDFVYLVDSQITTSVKGETGNGGNIAIDPQFVVLNHSSIIAQAIEGHGGNITIDAGEFLKSADSIVSASSELGISGTVEIIGPRVDLNGALVELSSELRSAAQVLRSGCAAQSGRPQSNLLVQASGRLPQDPDTTLRSFYLGGEDRPPAAASVASAAAGPALASALRLRPHCD
jgi:filamentous hemagglutinin family protein